MQGLPTWWLWVIRGGIVNWQFLLLACKKWHIPKLPLNLLHLGLTKVNFWPKSSQIMAKTWENLFSIKTNLLQSLHSWFKWCRGNFKSFWSHHVLSESEVFGILRSSFDHFGEVQIAQNLADLYILEKGFVKFQMKRRSDELETDHQKWIGKAIHGGTPAGGPPCFKDGAFAWPLCGSRKLWNLANESYMSRDVLTKFHANWNSDKQIMMLV